MKTVKKILLAAGIFAIILSAVLLFLNVHFGNAMLVAVFGAFMAYIAIFEKLPLKIHAAIWATCLVPVIFAGFLAAYGTNRIVNCVKADAVIVLGAGLRGEEVGENLARRLDAAIEYLNRNQHAVVVVSGGLGAGRTITEAEAMKRYLVRHGIAPERIIQEGQATSTYENLLFSNEILRNYFPYGHHFIIATNDFHIFRATRLARNLDINASPLSAPTPWQSIPANYLREIFAVVNMWVFG